MSRVESTKGRGVGRRWHRWTESEAREALEEFAAGGESAAVFARRRGISTQRLGYWRRRLSRSGMTEFVAVALPDVSRAFLEIAVGGVVVRVREDLDVGHVAGLVEAIGRRWGGPC